MSGWVWTASIEIVVVFGVLVKIASLHFWSSESGLVSVVVTIAVVVVFALNIRVQSYYMINVDYLSRFVVTPFRFRVNIESSHF